MFSKKSFILFLILFSFVVNIISYSQAVHEMSGGQYITQSDFKLGMRKLWEDHVMWTRNVIFNIVDDLGGTDAAVNRLLGNQTDIGNAIKPYYGEDAGNKLTELLRTHITQAADLLKAAKTQNQNEFNKLNSDWKKNGDDIAEFLSGANPNWSLSDLKHMMSEHLSLTIDEATARIKKDYAGDVVAYDKVHDEIIMMSDALADGIIKQFPDKFSR